MTTKKEYEENKKYFDSEIEKLSDYLKVEITENTDATGEVMMCFWLCKKEKQKKNNLRFRFIGFGNNKNCFGGSK